MFSDALLSQPLIKEKFSEVLNSLGNAVSSGMDSPNNFHKSIFLCI